MAGIYIHIPFCKQACHYCDFHFSTSMKSKDWVLKAIQKEIEIQQDYLDGEEISTIYFGGGTPSILTSDELKTILDQIKKFHRINDDLEITLECNPDDLDREKLQKFKSIGINRLSIGIQSFRNEDLELMNRAHNAGEALNSVKIAQEVGFENITIDLIYSIPNLSNTDWLANLKQAIDLNVPHISSYCLTIEDGTAFGHFAKKGKLIPVKDAVAADQYQLMVDEFSSVGYDHYEVSNFAKPGFISKHNSSYWRNKKYLGIGPSAHSFDGKTRQWNISNNVKYYQAIEKNISFFEIENLDNTTRYNEYILTGLRTKWGINIEYISSEFGIEFESKFGGYLQILIQNKEVQMNNQVISLTEKGFLIADGISSDLFLV